MNFDTVLPFLFLHFIFTFLLNCYISDYCNLKVTDSVAIPSCSSWQVPAGHGEAAAASGQCSHALGPRVFRCEASADHDVPVGSEEYRGQSYSQSEALLHLWRNQLHSSGAVC